MLVGKKPKQKQYYTKLKKNKKNPTSFKEISKTPNNKQIALKYKVDNKMATSANTNI